MIQFTRRARVRKSELTRQRHYSSLCGRYDLIEVRWLFPESYGHYWLACSSLGISRHRTRKAAERKLLQLERAKR